jgi:hypothetical protein
MKNNIDYCSHKTSVNRIARGLKLLATLTPKPKHNLDYGGGKFDKGTEYLAQQGIINYVYDPYNRTPEHNREALRHDFDSVTLLNVLNVIADRSERIAVIHDAYVQLKRGGIMIIQIYEGDKSCVGKISKTKTYQHNHPMGKYLNEIAEGLEFNIYGLARFMRRNNTNKSFIINKP